MNHKTTEQSELEGTQKSHQVQLWSEWPIQGSNPQPWHYSQHPLTNRANLKNNKFC